MFLSELWALYIVSSIIQGLVVSGGEDGRISLWQVGKSRMSGSEGHLKDDSENEHEDENVEMETEEVPKNPPTGRRRRESAEADDTKASSHTNLHQRISSIFIILLGIEEGKKRGLGKGVLHYRFGSWHSSLVQIE
jgi:hypothetical protein